jgi:hypothetical protein
MVLATIAGTGSSFAGVIWIGRPTVRDCMAYSAQRAMEQFGQMAQEIAVFSAQIEAARTEYFEASPVNRAAAGDKFGTLLLQKDLLIGGPGVMGGERGGDIASLFMMLANNGKLPDDGIPPTARLPTVSGSGP